MCRNSRSLHANFDSFNAALMSFSGELNNNLKVTSEVSNRITMSQATRIFSSFTPHGAPRLTRRPRGRNITSSSLSKLGHDRHIRHVPSRFNRNLGKPATALVTSPAVTLPALGICISHFHQLSNRSRKQEFRLGDRCDA